MKRQTYSVDRAQRIIRRAGGYTGRVINRPEGSIIVPWPGSREVLSITDAADRSHQFVHRHHLASFVQYLRSL